MVHRTPRRVVIEGIICSAVVYVLSGALAVHFIETGQYRYARNVIVILGGLLALIVWLSIIEARRTWLGLSTTTADTQWPAAAIFAATFALLLALGI
jgi:hypothetical protein